MKNYINLHLDNIDIDINNFEIKFDSKDLFKKYNPISHLVLEIINEKQLLLKGEIPVILFNNSMRLYIDNIIVTKKNYKEKQEDLLKHLLPYTKRTDFKQEEIWNYCLAYVSMFNVMTYVHWKNDKLRNTLVYCFSLIEEYIKLLIYSNFNLEQAKIEIDNVFKSLVKNLYRDIKLFDYEVKNRNWIYNYIRQQIINPIPWWYIDKKQIAKNLDEYTLWFKIKHFFDKKK